MTPPGPTPLVEQSAETSLTTTVHTVTLAPAPADGNALVVVVLVGATTTVSSVAPQAGTASFSQTVGLVAQGLNAEIWHAVNISGVGTLIDITLAGSSYARVCAIEVSGMNNASPVDQTNTDDAASGFNIDTGIITVLERNEFLVGGFINTPKDIRATQVPTGAPQWEFQCDPLLASTFGTAAAADESSKDSGNLRGLALIDVGLHSGAVGCIASFKAAIESLPAAKSNVNTSNSDLLRVAV